MGFYLEPCLLCSQLWGSTYNLQVFPKRDTRRSPLCAYVCTCVLRCVMLLFITKWSGSGVCYTHYPPPAVQLLFLPTIPWCRGEVLEPFITISDLFFINTFPPCLCLSILFLYLHHAMLSVIWNLLFLTKFENKFKSFQHKSWLRTQEDL